MVDDWLLTLSVFLNIFGISLISWTVWRTYTDDPAKVAELKSKIETLRARRTELLGLLAAGEERHNMVDKVFRQELDEDYERATARYNRDMYRGPEFWKWCVLTSVASNYAWYLEHLNWRTEFRLKSFDGSNPPSTYTPSRSLVSEGQ